VDYVSQHGSNEDVLAFSTENVRALNLDKIAFRMKDFLFFEATTKLLQERHLYQPTLWSYGIFHADVPTARQFLLHADALVNEAGGPIESTLLKIDPVARHQYEHLEYKPLVNARAHALGRKRQIVNEVVNAQYHKFLKTLSYHRDLDDNDLLALTYTSCCRIASPRPRRHLASQSAEDPDPDAVRLLRAYLEMFNDDPKKARSIVASTSIIRSIAGAIPSTRSWPSWMRSKERSPGGRSARQGAQQENLAATEPSFEFTLENKAIQLTWQNLETVRVNYYLMDVELLFSRNPFVQQGGNQFASIRPNATQITLLKGQNKSAIPLPDDLASATCSWK
jgi:hypothetical protein